MRASSHLLLSEHLLDADGLHGGEGLSPFQKALRDRRYLFSKGEHEGADLATLTHEAGGSLSSGSSGRKTPPPPR